MRYNLHEQGHWLQGRHNSAGWSLLMVVVFCVLFFRYLDAKEAGRLDDGIDPPWMTAPPEDADVPENTPSTSPRQ